MHQNTFQFKVSTLT